MARPRARELTERELEIMHIFWERGETTAQDVRDRLALGGRDLAYTTVATLIRILHGKGCLHQTNDQRPFRYIAARTFEDVSGNLLREMLQRVFGGSREALLVRLIEDRRLTAKERRAIEAILREESS